MSDASEPPSEDSSDEAIATTDTSESPLSSLWVQFRALLLSVAASAALHFAAGGVIYWVSTFTIDIGAEAEWLNTSNRLTGLGHRSEADFANLGDVTEENQKPEEEPEPPETDAEEELERALDGSYEPPEEPEPPERDASRDSESSRSPPERESESSEQHERSSKSSSESTDAPSFPDVGSHDALDRQGPNDLPDMRSFAPGNARMSALVRTDRLRGEPYEDAVRKILRAVPDYRLLLGVPDFDPIRDMDWFFMASPNPQRVDMTFLVVQHRLSARRVRALVDRRYANPPEWGQYRDHPVRDLVPENPDYRDPRKILLADEGLAVVARPNLLPQVVEPLSRDSELLSRASSTKEADGERDDSGASGVRRPSLLDGLAKIHEAAQREKTIVLMSARGLVFFMPGVGRLPRFESVRLKVSHPEQPTLNIDLQFEDVSAAAEFADQCPEIRAAIEDGIPFSGALGLSDKLRRLDCRAEEDYVNVHGEFTRQEVADLANMAYPFIPRPRSLNKLPEPPEPERDDEGPSASTRDAGNSPSGSGGGGPSGSPDAGSGRTAPE